MWNKAVCSCGVCIWMTQLPAEKVKASLLLQKAEAVNAAGKGFPPCMKNSPFPPLYFIVMRTSCCSNVAKSLQWWMDTKVSGISLPLIHVQPIFVIKVKRDCETLHEGKMPSSLTPFVPKAFIWRRVTRLGEMIGGHKLHVSTWHCYCFPDPSVLKGQQSTALDTGGKEGGLPKLCKWQAAVGPTVDRLCLMGKATMCVCASFSLMNLMI